MIRAGNNEVFGVQWEAGAIVAQDLRSVSGPLCSVVKLPYLHTYYKADALMQLTTVLKYPPETKKVLDGLILFSKIMV